MIDKKIKDEFIKNANPNEAQKLAIETTDKNVGVVAGAGTGKTKILTNRFIDILLESENPEEVIEKILAITFTKKATAEMVSRIENEIIKLGNLDESFKSLVNKIPYLSISTIDSFCKNIVDENALYLGIDPDYKIMDDTESKKLLSEIIKKVINNNHNEILDKFLENNQIILLDNLIRDLGASYNRIISKGYEFSELYSKLSFEKAREVDFNDFLGRLYSFLDREIEKKTINGNFSLKKNYTKGIYNTLLDKNADRIEILSKLLDNLTDLYKKETVDIELLDILCSETRDSIFYLESSDVIFYEYFNNLLIEIHREYTDFKLKNGMFEFSDLMYLTKKVFDNNELLKIYQNSYDYIMIDEYQDTNRLQRDIFYSLSSVNKKLDKNNFFVVGDKKQSIYGFRGSDVRVFDETLEDIIESGGEIITLKYNYRSTEEIINYTNHVFKNIMGDVYDPIYSGLSNKINDLVKVKFINLSNSELSEPEAICTQILNLVDNGKKFGDIAILFRTTTHLYELEKELNSYNIPYVNNKSKYFLEKQEIKDLILFLKFLNNKDDSVSLYGLLRSKIFSVSDSDLYDLSKLSEVSLYDGLLKYSGEKINIIKSREILEEMQILKDKISLYDLFTRFINDTHYIEILSILSNNTQEIENVNTFRDLIFNFEKNNSSKVYDLLDYLVLSDLDDISEAKVFSNDSVNLMTIHGSKGLEFNTVILYDSESQKKSETSKIVFNSDRGYGIKTNPNSNYYRDIVSSNSMLDDEELDRVLYVCITRAKDEFIFLGKEYDKEKSNFSYKLQSVGYEYNNIENIERLEKSPKKKVKLIINYKEEENINNKENELAVGSFSSYKTFKKSKRDYFIKYKLGLRDIEKYEEDEGELEAIDTINLEENYFTIDASKYGSLIHEIIENIEEDSDLGLLSKIYLEKYGFKDDLVLSERIYRHLSSYIKYNEKYDKKYNEFSFLLKLEEGYISGSIDEIAIKNDEIYITDFKTNRVSDLNYLIEYYKPQLIIYSMAIHQIFNKFPEKAHIHFLDIDKKIEIDIKEDDYNNLTKELNSFLRFIRLNDSIESYI